MRACIICAVARPWLSRRWLQKTPPVQAQFKMAKAMETSTEVSCTLSRRARSITPHFAGDGGDEQARQDWRGPGEQSGRDALASCHRRILLPWHKQ